MSGRDRKRRARGKKGKTGRGRKLLQGVRGSLDQGLTEVKGRLSQGMEPRRLLLYLPCLFLFWFFDKAGEAYRLAPGGDVVTKAVGALGSVEGVCVRNLLPSLHPRDLMAGAVCTAAVWAAVYFKAKNARKFRHGVEYGSARWGTGRDIRPFIDRDFGKNILLTQTERIMLGRNRIPKYNINKNILIIGGSGSGKTRFHVKPNLMQMNASYLVTDPNGYTIRG